MPAESFKDQDSEEEIDFDDIYDEQKRQEEEDEDGCDGEFDDSFLPSVGGLNPMPWDTIH